MKVEIVNWKYLYKVQKYAHTKLVLTMKHGLQKKISSDMIKTLSLRSSICFIIYRFSLLPFSKLKNLSVWNNGSYCTLFNINYGSFSPWYVTHVLIRIFFVSEDIKNFWEMFYYNSILSKYRYNESSIIYIWCLDIPAYWKHSPIKLSIIYAIVYAFF